jgi:hypothetical protein
MLLVSTSDLILVSLTVCTVPFCFFNSTKGGNEMLDSLGAVIVLEGENFSE